MWTSNTSTAIKVEPDEVDVLNELNEPDKSSTTTSTSICRSTSTSTTTRTSTNTTTTSTSTSANTGSSTITNTSIGSSTSDINTSTSINDTNTNTSPSTSGTNTNTSTSTSGTDTNTSTSTSGTNTNINTSTSGINTNTSTSTSGTNTNTSTGTSSTNANINTSTSGINTNTSTSTTGTNSIKRKVSTNLTLQKKLEAVRKKDAGLSTIEIAMEYNISETTVRRWIREREKLERHSLSLTSKRLRLSPVEKVNEALTIWFHGERKRNNALTVIQVKAKAQEFFQRFGGTESFKASDGWYRTWKLRNGIRSIAPSGEASSTNTKAANQFTAEISKLIEKENLTLYQIFNADETELYFRMMPNRSSIIKTEYGVPGHKKINDKLTVMACCNANGTFKMPLLVIGKHQRPTALKNIVPKLLSVKYTNQKNGWMSAIIFERWFKEDFVPQVVSFLKSKGLPEKAILLLDNDRSYPSANMLTVDGIRAIFFPSYVTPLIQPLDQGIIKIVKWRYKAKFLKFLINAQADGMSFNRAMDSFNVKNAIDLISDAWDEITEKTISNCWKKLLNMPVDEDNNIDYINSEQIQQMCKKLRSHEDVTLDEINEWIHNDCLSTLTDEEIIDAVENPWNDETDTENDHSMQNGILPSAAMEGLDCAISFFEETGLISLTDMKVLKRVRDELLKIKNRI